MNKQEIFDKVIQHARTQNKTAINKQNECVYRTKNGLKCFIGCLIPDDKYEPFMEGITISSILILDAIGIPNNQRTKQNLSFLRQLQIIHDGCPVDKWEEELQSFAKQYDLIYNPPDNKS